MTAVGKRAYSKVIYNNKDDEGDHSVIETLQ